MIKYVAAFAVGFALAAIIFSSMDAEAPSHAASIDRETLWKTFEAQEIPKARESAASEAQMELQETAVNAGFAYFGEKEDGARTFRWLVCKDH